MAGERIRITLKAYDHRLLDQSAARIVEAARTTGASLSGPIPLPTRRRLTCVVKPTALGRSSRSMEHFEMRVHKRLIDIHGPTSETIDALMHLDLPYGVNVEIKA